MPLSYTLDEARGIVVERWSGDVSIAEISAHWAMMLDNPAALRMGRGLVELVDIRQRFTGPEMMHAVGRLVVLLNGTRWRTAVVAPRVDLFGSSRQFQTMAEPHVTTEIFDNREAALAWLLDAP